MAKSFLDDKMFIVIGPFLHVVSLRQVTVSFAQATAPGIALPVGDDDFDVRMWEKTIQGPRAHTPNPLDVRQFRSTDGHY